VDRLQLFSQVQSPGNGADLVVVSAVISGGAGVAAGAAAARPPTIEPAVSHASAERNALRVTARRHRGGVKSIAE
jgi:hypothetical protein